MRKTKDFFHSSILVFLFLTDIRPLYYKGHLLDIRHQLEGVVEEGVVCLEEGFVLVARVVEEEVEEVFQLVELEMKLFSSNLTSNYLFQNQHQTTGLFPNHHILGFRNIADRDNPGCYQ
jgi:hypothetical protein